MLCGKYFLEVFVTIMQRVYVKILGLLFPSETFFAELWTFLPTVLNVSNYSIGRRENLPFVKMRRFCSKYVGVCPKACLQ